MDYKEKFKKISGIDIEEVNKPSKITNFMGEELTQEKIEEYKREKAKQDEENKKYILEHKDDPIFKDFFKGR